MYNQLGIICIVLAQLIIDSQKITCGKSANNLCGMIVSSCDVNNAQEMIML